MNRINARIVQDLALKDYIHTTDIIDNSTNTSLENILFDAVNVIQFGAKGDGQHDDTECIQNAINNAQTKNKVLYFPPGTYCVFPTAKECGLNGRTDGRCHHALFITSPLRVVGNGTKIKIGAKAGKEYLYASVFCVKSSNVSFNNIQFIDGNPFYGSESDPTSIRHTYAISMGSYVDAKSEEDPDGTDWFSSNSSICYENIQIKNCRFEKFFYAVFLRFTADYMWDNSLRDVKVKHALIQNVNVYDCDFIGRDFIKNTRFGSSIDNNAGINIASGIPSEYGFINDLRIQGCHFKRASNSAALGMSSVNNFIVLGCSLEDCDQVGIEIENSGEYGNGVIQNISLKECDYGIMIDDSSNISITGVTYSKHKITNSSHDLDDPDDSFGGGPRCQSICIAITAQGVSDQFDIYGGDLWGNGKTCDNITVSDVNSCNGAFKIDIFGQVGAGAAGNGIGNVQINNVALKVESIDGRPIDTGGSYGYAFVLNDPWAKGHHGEDVAPRGVFLLNNVSAKGFRNGIYAGAAKYCIVNNFNIDLGKGPFAGENPPQGPDDEKPQRDIVNQTYRCKNLILTNGTFEYSQTEDCEYVMNIRPNFSSCQHVYINKGQINDFASIYMNVQQIINEELKAGANKTAFIVYPQNNETELSMHVQAFQDRQDRTIEIDWGDGNLSSFGSSGTNGSTLSHVYAEGFLYTVRVGNAMAMKIVGGQGTVVGVAKWSDDIKIVNDCFMNCHNLKCKVPEWGNSITQAFRCWYRTQVMGRVPGWKNVQYIGGCYYGCAGLTGEIPEFPERILMNYAGLIYGGCGGLTGRIPELPNNIIVMTGIFKGCAGLTGGIPELPSGITNMNEAFYGCEQLTGRIPELPNSLNSMNCAFRDCAGLTGFWEGAVIARTCPDTVPYHNDCYAGCCDQIMDLAYKSWGGSVPDPV